jgi:predicted oxidoreductase
LNRGLDAYFPVGKKNTYNLSSIDVRDGFPLCLPASRLLRPYRPKELWLNQLKIQRIKSEMMQAARDNEVYHVWWHPHNFGNYPQQSLEALEQILKAYQTCANQYGMVSMNMGEVTNAVYSLHGKNQAA